MKITARQWRALAGACLLQCAMMGVLINCSGVLFAQIRMDTGIRMTEMSAFNTIKSVTGALLSATVTGLFFRKNQKYGLLMNQALMCLSYLMMTIRPGGPIWYAAAILSGVSGCLCVVAIPSILNRVFPLQSGTPTGFAMAFSGIGGAIFNPLCAWLITAVGWRWTIGILCLTDMLLSMAGLQLLFGNAGIDRADAPAQSGEKRREEIGPFDWKHCIPVTMVLVGGGLGFQFATNLSIFVQNNGYSLQVGATLTTMLMLGNVAGKFVYGFLCDRIGVWKTTAAGLFCVMIGTLIFLLLGQNLILLYFAALLFGNIYALSTISVSRCCMAAYGMTHYTRYIGIHNGINQAIMAVASMATGMIFDATGSFAPILAFTLAGLILSLAGVWLLRKTGAESPHSSESELRELGEACSSN